MQWSSLERPGKHISAQAQWRHIPAVLAITWLVFRVSMLRLYNEDLFEIKLVESPGGFSSWEYKDKNGVWIVKIEYRLGERSTEWLEARSLYSDLKCQFPCLDPLLRDD
jgi:hypothetical protein